MGLIHRIHPFCFAVGPSITRPIPLQMAPAVLVMQFPLLLDLGVCPLLAIVLSWTVTSSASTLLCAAKTPQGNCRCSHCLRPVRRAQTRDSPVQNDGGALFSKSGFDIRCATQCESLNTPDLTAKATSELSSQPAEAVSF